MVGEGELLEYKASEKKEEVDDDDDDGDPSCKIE